VSEKRVIYRGAMIGVVLEKTEERSHVHWGTVDRKPVTEWVANDDLEPLTEPVFYGDGAKKGLVYDPGLGE
jgi:hypothetical protein